uniref:Uncharacterized protein n=1 Tax=Nothobranchius furzeri TaxID=105023 RepID=A0A8C6LW66_NOTFU
MCGDLLPHNPACKPDSGKRTEYQRKHFADSSPPQAGLRANNRRWKRVLLRHPSVQTTCSGSYWCTVVCTLVRLCMEVHRQPVIMTSAKATLDKGQQNPIGLVKCLTCLSLCMRTCAPAYANTMTLICMLCTCGDVCLIHSFIRVLVEYHTSELLSSSF